MTIEKAALQKARAEGAMTSEDLSSLSGTSIGTLIVDHDLNFEEAKGVMIWLQHEGQRVRAQKQFDEYDKKGSTIESPKLNANDKSSGTGEGEKKGSTYPAIDESLLRLVEARVIKRLRASSKK